MTSIEINSIPTQEQIDIDHGTALRSVKLAERLSRQAEKMVKRGEISADAKEPLRERLAWNPERREDNDPALTEYVTNYDLRASGIEVAIQPGQRDIVKSESDTLVIKSVDGKPVEEKPTK